MSDLGPNDGFSLELGGDILEDVSSTCPDQTLKMLGATGWKNIQILSPFISMLALCSIWQHSASNSSAAKKGCHFQILCLVVFIRIHGTDLTFVMATNLVTTLPMGRLCSACSTRHVTCDGILLVHPQNCDERVPGDANRVFL